MKFSRSLVVSAVFVLIAVAVAAWLYPHLPARVPSHWNLQGQVDGTLPRGWGAAMPALMVLGVAVLTVVLPYISPRSFEIRPFGPVYVGLMLVIQGFVLVIGLATLLTGAGYPVPVPMLVMVCVGLLFMVLGNYMGKLRKNFFIGIRTPWTLASDAVWERTHRLGGWTFMLGGVLFVVAAFTGGGMWLPIVAVVIAAVVPMAYSWFIYRRLEGRAGRGG